MCKASAIAKFTWKIAEPQPIFYKNRHYLRSKTAYY